MFYRGKTTLGIFRFLFVSLTAVLLTGSIANAQLALDKRLFPCYRPSGFGSGTTRDQIMSDYGRLPLQFEGNSGQIDSRVNFLARGSGYCLFLTKTEAVLTLNKPCVDSVFQRNARWRAHTTDTPGRPSFHTTVFRMKLLGASAHPRISGITSVPGTSNYFLGNDPAKWRTEIPNYSKVGYKDIYPGIDLVYYGNQQQLEYDFVVAPHADPSRICLSMTGAERLRITPQGELEANLPGGCLRWHCPQVYQEVEGKQRSIPARYVLGGKNRVGFRITHYDPNRSLVIDPVLVYSTYLGGSGNESAFGGIAVDSAGNAYVAGYTDSANFPTTEGPTSAVGLDIFISKLNASGTGLVYSTLLGGSGDDRAYGLTIDANGNAYITGHTYSADFPTTPNAYQRSRLGYPDACLTKLSSDGSTLLYSTYLGGAGSGGSWSNQVVIDQNGDAFVAGYTSSLNFPTTAGAYQLTNHGGFDSFVTKFNPSGTALIYSTYLGGSGTDYNGSLCIDDAGNAYVVGETTSSDFPTTSGAYQRSNGGGFDGFVTKLNAKGSALVYSTFLGGNAEDECDSIVVDKAGNAHLAGFSASTNFPTTPGAYQRTNGGGYDAILAKLNASGSKLLYSTYLGGSGDDLAIDLALDSSGYAYITGRTGSANFPTTPNALQTTFGGGSTDGFITKINPKASDLVYSTYLGGNGNDEGDGITIDEFGRIYVLSTTSSTNFPTTAGVYQPHSGGNADSAISYLHLLPSIASLLPSSTDAGGADFTLTIQGSNFDETSVVNWTVGTTRTALPLTSASTYVLKVKVPSSLIAHPGKASVSVNIPGVGTSNSKSFTILEATLKLLSATLTKDSSTGAYTANITLQNAGYLTADNAKITQSTLGAAGTSTFLPVGVGNMAAGSTATSALTYPASAGTSGSVVTLKVSGTFTGGSFSSSLKITLP